jgi:hypothetical protein
MEVRKNCLEKCGYTLSKARNKTKTDKFLTKTPNSRSGLPGDFFKFKFLEAKFK